MNRLINFSLSIIFLVNVFVVAQVKQSAASNFKITEIGKNVFSVIRLDPPGLMCDGNSGFIINEDHVVVIDAPEASQQILAEIKKITDKPVKYVINTHWHDDHITGNKIYKEAFPNIEFIAHTSTKEYLPVQGLTNRKNMIEGAPGGVEYLKSLLQKNQSPDGTEMTPEERESFTSDINLVEHYLNFVPGIEIVLPTITFNEKYTLSESGRVIEILKIGDGHTAGDIIVYLPKEKIIFSGDLIVFPIPLVGGNQSHILTWPDALQKLLLLNPSLIVPGHGPLMNNNRYVLKLINLFSFIKQSVVACVKENKTLEETRKSINLEEYKKLFAGESKLKRFLFSTYVAGPSITAAYNELSPKK